MHAEADGNHDASSDLLEMLLQTQGDGQSICLDSIERTLVERAVLVSKGNYSAAARMLNITRSQLAYRCEKYRLAEHEGG